MISEFIFFVGLPGCGKSTYIEERWGKCRKNVHIVSADEIKKQLKGYDNAHPEHVHQHSVKLAEQQVYNLIEDAHGTVVLDGGGINNRYNQRIIEYIRENSKHTKITCLFFDTPIEVCLKRIEGRERKVPVEDVYKKNLKLVSCLQRYIPLVDNFERISYYTNQKLFLDMDGTIAAYGKNKYDEYGNKDFCCSELFLHLQPVTSIIEYVRAHWDMKDVYICSAVANSVVWDEKNVWLDKHFPEIPKENRLFVGNKEYKHVFIKNYCQKMKWDLKDVVLVDDLHDTLHKCEKYGINAVHPSNIDSLFNKYTCLS